MGTIPQIVPKSTVELMKLLAILTTLIISGLSLYSTRKLFFERKIKFSTLSFSFLTGDFYKGF